MYCLVADLPMPFLPWLMREDGDEILLNDLGLWELIDQAALVHGVDISASRLALHIHPLPTADV